MFTRASPPEIVAAVEQGAGEWRAPWFHNGTSSARPTNVASGKRYRGINAVALWVTAMDAGYSDGLWGTYRQWQDAGAQVREGERATAVALWKQIVSSEPADDDEGDDGGPRRPRGERRMDRAVRIEASIDRQAVGTRQLAIAGLCGVLAMIDGFDAQAMSFAAPVIARELGSPGPQFGPIFRAGARGALIGVIVQGSLGDRYGRKTIMLASFAMVGTASLSIISTRGLEALIFLRLLEGVGLGGALPTSSRSRRNMSRSGGARPS